MCPLAVIMAPSRGNAASSGIMLTYLCQLKINKRLVHFQADCCSRDKFTLSFAFLKSSSELLACLLFCPRFHNWSWRPAERGAAGCRALQLFQTTGKNIVLTMDLFPSVFSSNFCFLWMTLYVALCPISFLILFFFQQCENTTSSHDLQLFFDGCDLCQFLLQFCPHP